MAVAGIDVVHVAAVDVEDRMKDRHERLVHLQRRLHHSRRKPHRLLEVLHLRRRSQCCPDSGHHHRRGEALAHHVAEGDRDSTGIGLVPVVEIAADLTRRRKVRCHLEPVAGHRRLGTDHSRIP